MKRIIFVITILLSFFIGTVVSSNSNLKVVVNGKLLSSEAIMKDDRVYVPLRAVSETLGATVGWDNETNTASVNMIEDDYISKMINDVSQSVVAIVGNYKEEYDYQSNQVERTAHGTGVVIKSGGEILTNAHVVKDLEQIIVVTNEGDGYQGRLKFMDEKLDLAVVKIDKLGLIPIKFADYSSIISGKTVFAIGTPISFSNRNAATRGIISGLNSSVGYDYRLIHTDAAINGGNSGGPLVNMSGELVGINTIKLVGVGVEGMNFSIPVNIVKNTLWQFENYGKVRRAKTGITFDESWASRLGLPTKEGLTIKKIDANSEAEKRLLNIGDILIKVNGTYVHSLVDYNEAIKEYKMGEEVNFTYLRGGQELITAFELND